MRQRQHSRADLHVHSKYSDRPSEWFLRRVGAPECFVEPAEVYRRARARGMDFVTLADHNCIRGALEIAHLPGTFLSSEITTYFPEDGCKVHCLVAGIDESQFRVLDELRPNIYELREYLAEQRIFATITHPLFRVNDRLTIEHLEQLLQKAQPRPASRLSRFVPGFARRLVQSRRLRHANDMERLILTELSGLAGDDLAPAHSVSRPDDLRIFDTACRIAHPLGFGLLRNMERSLREGQLMEGLQAAAALGTVAMGLAPYLAAFSTQHKDDAFLRAVAAHFLAPGRLAEGDGGTAWITDTFGDVNGVSRTGHAAGVAAKTQGQDLCILTCQEQAEEVPFARTNFRPVGTFPLPEYESLRLCFPPILEVIEHIERHRYHRLILSTPGPLGLAGLLASRLLGVRRVGIYHTDFPMYVRHLTGDRAMEVGGMFELAGNQISGFDEKDSSALSLASAPFGRTMPDSSPTLHRDLLPPCGRVVACTSPLFGRARTRPHDKPSSDAAGGIDASLPLQQGD